MTKVVVDLAELVLSPKEKARRDMLAAPVRPLNTVPESGQFNVMTGGSGDGKFSTENFLNWICT